MRHTRLENRVERARHINRKFEIIKNTYNWSPDYLAQYDKGRLSKNKVHCSCGICQCKSTKYLGHKNKSILNYSASDRRKFEKMSISD